MPTFKLPLSGDVVQSINPFTAFMTGGQFGLININLGQSSEPKVEEEVLSDVATYGKQLGRIGDALIVLLDHFHPRKPLTADETDAIDAMLDRVHGVVLIGGEDMCGVWSGREEADSQHAGHNDERDSFEVALARRAWERDIPLLGICRGAQVLNVALGGTLHQHLPDVIGHSGHRAGNAVFTTLPVRTVPGTRLAALVGESVDARCYHHQGIAELGEGLVVSGWDADGVIEALELPGHGFVLAVQWHPEESLDDLRLFSAIVEAARSYANRRVS